jgi:hypothetical protein
MGVLVHVPLLLTIYVAVPALPEEGVIVGAVEFTGAKVLAVPVVLLLPLVYPDLVVVTVTVDD